MARITLALALILAAVLALLVAQNTDAVTLHFLWSTHKAVPLSLALLGASVLGALIGLLIGIPGQFRNTRGQGELTRRTARQEALITQLQTGMTDEHAASRPSERRRS